MKEIRKKPKSFFSSSFSSLCLSFIFLFELVLSCPLYGQDLFVDQNGPLEHNVINGKKPVVKDYDLWESIFLRRISNNGDWISYTMTYSNNIDTLFVKNTKTHKVFKVPNGHYDGTFSCKDEFFSFRLKGKLKGVGYINLRTGEQTQFEGAVKSNFSPDGTFLVIYIEENDNLKDYNQSNLIVKNLKSGTSITFKNVSEYGFMGKSNKLVYIARNKTKHIVGIKNLERKNEPSEIIISNLKNYYHRLIWSENKNSFAFMEAFTDGRFNKESQILHHFHKDELYSFDHREHYEFPKQMYVSGSQAAKFLIYENSPRVFFGIAAWTFKEGNGLDESQKSKVQVWSWKDMEIYPKLKNINQYPDPFLSVWLPTSDTFRQIVYSEEKVMSGNSNAILICRPLEYRPMFKYAEDFVDIYIVDVVTGNKELVLKKQLNRSNNISLSPKGNYLGYFKDRNWWIYDVKCKIHKNITKNLLNPTYKTKGMLSRSPIPYGRQGWTENDKNFIIHDQFDIWFVSPDGNSQKRLTNGRAFNKRYRLYHHQYTESKKRDYLLYKGSLFNTKEGLVFQSFGVNTKRSGYAIWNRREGVQDLMYDDMHVGRLLKAKHSSNYVVREERFDMPPKLVSYSKKGNKKIVQSNAHHYNFEWGRSELIEYEVAGETLNGALFYPANYDSRKQYPMVVGIYEKKSQELHHYVNPSNQMSFGFNSTVFTLNDYFVLYPDIIYDYNNPGISATKCVTSAVERVMKMGIIDRNKIGLWGHSFGGYETTFILTQTDMFAAAVAGAPAYMDLVSSYLGNFYNVYSETEWFENSQPRFTGSFWEYRSSYLNNSPIHNLDKINTPLMSWQGVKDMRVDFKQGIMMYNAMRRLEKEHVFLVYPNGGHTLDNTVDQIDLSKKVLHWFNYKLKGKKAKTWALKGDFNN